MVLWYCTWNIDKDKVKEYSKWAQEESVPFWMKQKGLKEFRAYRYPGTTKAIIMVEFDSVESWGKAMDSYLKTDMPDKMAMYTSNMDYTLYHTSPLIPEPLKPK